MCEKNTVECVAEKMLSVCRQDHEYYRMAKSAKEYSEKFKWENNGKLLDEALTKIYMQRDERSVF